jgi:4'-phosphopantetheinyl transferase
LPSATDAPRAAAPGHAWLPPPELPRLEPGKLDVHTGPLEVGERALDRAWAALGEAERIRADRFRFDRDRRRFVVAHALMRRVLARHTGVAPASVPVQQICPTCGGDHGPPRVPGHALHVSLSHSGELAAVAVAASPVGVDLELLRRRLSVPGLASQSLAPVERARLDGLDPGEARAAFLAAWVRKEAYAKGRGLGLALPFRSFAMEPAGAGHWRVAAAEPVGAEHAAGWCVVDLELPGYAGAAAHRGPLAALRTYVWPG